MSVDDFTPTADEVGSLMRSRTVESNGVQAGVFTATTNPTMEGASAEIQWAVLDLSLLIGTEIPSDYWPAAKQLAILRSAMYIELNYWPEQVMTGKSPYPEYKRLFDELFPSLVAAIEREEAGGAGAEDAADAGEGGGGSGLADFLFNPPVDSMGRTRLGDSVL